MCDFVKNLLFIQERKQIYGFFDFTILQYGFNRYNWTQINEIVKVGLKLYQFKKVADNSIKFCMKFTI